MTAHNSNNKGILESTMLSLSTTSTIALIMGCVMLTTPMWSVNGQMQYLFGNNNQGDCFGQCEKICTVPDKNEAQAYCSAVKVFIILSIISLGLTIIMNILGIQHVNFPIFKHIFGPIVGMLCSTFSAFIFGIIAILILFKAPNIGLNFGGKDADSVVKIETGGKMFIMYIIILFLNCIISSCQCGVLNELNIYREFPRILGSKFYPNKVYPHKEN